MSDFPTLVLADDESHIRLMMKTVLSAAGCKILAEASNGQEAMARYKELKPDLLLLDINMPIMTGEEALREIMQEFPEAKVIMLTSLADSQTVEHCLELGALDYLRKDTPLPQLKDFVLEAWRSS